MAHCLSLIFVLVFVLVFVGGLPLFASDALSREARSVPVNASPLRHFKIRDHDIQSFGPLTYLGGFEITSPVADVGGLSAVVSANQGQVLLLLADNALWLRLELDQTTNGSIDAISHAYLAPMLGVDGRHLIGSAKEDSESAVFIENDQLLVSFERAHRMLVYPVSESLLANREAALQALTSKAVERVALPSLFRSHYNGGLETLSTLDETGESVLLLNERPLQDKGSYVLGWAIKPQGSRQSDVRFRYAVSDGFEPTDAARLPNGEILVLERRFSIFRGMSMRLRKFDPKSIAPDQVVDAETLLQVGMDHQIDNMEALDVAIAPDGSTILTLVSDNNRSILQRTLLLRFRYEAETDKL